MKRSRLLTIALVSFASWIMFACDQVLDIKSTQSSFFVKYFGGKGSQTGIDMVVNSDGTFVLFGTTTDANGNTKFYLTKSDAMGNQIWEKTFPNRGTQSCQARDVELAADGSIIVVGNVMLANRTDNDIFVGRIEQNSDSSYYNVIGYSLKSGNPVDDEARCITPTKDGYIIAGTTGNITDALAPNNQLANTLPLFLRLNSTLDVYANTWPPAPTYSQGLDNSATKIIQVRDSLYVFGYSRRTRLGGAPDYNFWYFELNNAGTPDSQVGYFGVSNKDEKILDIVADTTPNGRGFFMAGIESDITGDQLYFGRLKSPPLAFDENTDYALYQPTFMGTALGKPTTGIILASPYPDNQWVSAVATAGGYFVLTNEVTSGNSNMILCKILDNGNYQSFTPCIFGGQGDDFAGAVKELPDGKIVIVGTMTVGVPKGSGSETKLVLIKVNKQGRLAD